MKNKITIDDQISHMKSKGIKFNIMSEDDAKNFLSQNTYYFKFKSYGKAFERNKGTFVNLDFAYIVELSKLDAHLRSFIIQLSLDTEHLLKAELIKDVTENEYADGYTVCKVFLECNERIKQKIENMKQNSASADLIYKYNNNWPIWALIEILSFGDFICLYRFYYEIYKLNRDQNKIDLLMSLKFLRNASAHNNCLLNSLRIPYTHTHMNNKNGITKTSSLMKTLATIPTIGQTSRKKKMSNPIVHDFVASLFLFDYVCSSDAIRKRTYNEINNLFKTRFIEHKDYFIQDTVFTSYYEFIIKIIDFLEDRSV